MLEDRLTLGASSLGHRSRRAQNDERDEQTERGEVLWVGTWRDTDEPLVEVPLVPDARPPEGEQTSEGEEEAAPRQPAAPTAVPTLASPFARRDLRPDVVILSMAAQDALTLKWALDRGLDIDLALRAQGDNSIFVTTGVSLPQLVEQGGLLIPERGDFDAHPRADDVEPPSLPPNPPE